MENEIDILLMCVCARAR